MMEGMTMRSLKWWQEVALWVAVVVMFAWVGVAVADTLGHHGRSGGVVGHPSVADHHHNVSGVVQHLHRHLDGVAYRDHTHFKFSRRGHEHGAYAAVDHGHDMPAPASPLGTQWLVPILPARGSIRIRAGSAASVVTVHFYDKHGEVVSGCDTGEGLAPRAIWSFSRSTGAKGCHDVDLPAGAWSAEVDATAPVFVAAFVDRVERGYSSLPAVKLP